MVAKITGNVTNSTARIVGRVKGTVAGRVTGTVRVVRRIKGDVAGVDVPTLLELAEKGGGGGGGGVDFTTDDTLTFKDGVLGVNTTNEAKEGDTRPITSAGAAALREEVETTPLTDAEIDEICEGANADEAMVFAEVVQTTGDRTDAVMSQAAVMRAIRESGGGSGGGSLNVDKDGNATITGGFAVDADGNATI